MQPGTIACNCMVAPSVALYEYNGGMQLQSMKATPAAVIFQINFMTLFLFYLFRFIAWKHSPEALLQKSPKNIHFHLQPFNFPYSGVDESWRLSANKWNLQKNLIILELSGFINCLEASKLDAESLAKLRYDEVARKKWRWFNYVFGMWFRQKVAAIGWNKLNFNCGSFFLSGMSGYFFHSEEIGLRELHKIQ